MGGILISVHLSGTISFSSPNSTSFNNPFTTPHIGAPDRKANMNDAVSEFNREKVKVSRTPVNIIVNPARIEQKLDIDKKPSSGRGDIFSFFHF